MDELNFEDVKVNKKTSKRGKRPKLLIIGALALCAAFVLFIVLSRWNYSSYQIKFSDPDENVLAYEYYGFENNILKVASDNASYINERNELYWTVSYDMTEPKVEFCESKAAIFDMNGNSVVVVSAKGQQGIIKTTMPIMKASVSRNGGVAVIMDDGNNAWIEYYDVGGEKISSFRTTIDETGYPYDIALSPDGTVMAVSFICYEDSQMTSRMNFYNFGSSGRDREDNLINSFAYSGILIPEIFYTDNTTIIALADDSVIVYKGKTEIREKRRTKLSGTVISAFRLDEKFVLVMEHDNSPVREAVVYGANGKAKTSTTVRLPYTKISAGKGDMIFYNRNQFVAYGSNGVKKFDGNAEALLRDIVPIGNNRFVMTTEDGYFLISLS